MKYIVKYDYIGEDGYPDTCYGIEDELETLEEAIERMNELNNCECYCNIEVITPDYFL